MTHNVTQIQQRLIALGYLAAGEDDGKFGAKSLDAYNHWRASKGAGPVNAASMSDSMPEISVAIAGARCSSEKRSMSSASSRELNLMSTPSCVARTRLVEICTESCTAITRDPLRRVYCEGMRILSVSPVGPSELHEESNCRFTVPMNADFSCASLSASRVIWSIVKRVLAMTLLLEKSRHRRGP